MTVFSDPDFTVNESNEDNNTMSVQFTMNNGVITDISPPQFSFSNHCFEDDFNDTNDLKRFFSELETGNRWALARNGAGVLCDLLIKTVGASDRVVETRFSGRAGDAGATWSLASWEGAYVPKGSPQTLKMRVLAPNGDLSTNFRKGRVAVAIVGRTAMSEKICSATGLAYEEQSFGGSTKVGIELETGRPFIFFDPPYEETIYDAIFLNNISEIQIAGKYTAADVTLTIRDGAGNLLFSATRGYPVNWNFTGTHSGCFAHWGISAGTSDTLYINNFQVSLP